MMIAIQLIFFAYSRYRLPFLAVLLPSVAYGWIQLIRLLVCVYLRSSAVPPRMNSGLRQMETHSSGLVGQDG
jgi:hypothetical protein